MSSSHAQPKVASNFIKPDKMVSNMGASQGAGNYDFQIYRNERNIELNRIALMEKEFHDKNNQLIYDTQVAKKKEELQRKEEKNREKRRKKKLSKENKKSKPNNLINDGSFMAEFLKKQALEKGNVLTKEQIKELDKKLEEDNESSSGSDSEDENKVKLTTSEYTTAETKTSEVDKDSKSEESKLSVSSTSAVTDDSLLVKRKPESN